MLIDNSNRLTMEKKNKNIVDPDQLTLFSFYCLCVQLVAFVACICTKVNFGLVIDIDFLFLLVVR